MTLTRTRFPSPFARLSSHSSHSPPSQVSVARALKLDCRWGRVLRSRRPAVLSSAGLSINNNHVVNSTTTPVTLDLPFDFGRLLVRLSPCSRPPHVDTPKHNAPYQQAEPPLTAQSHRAAAAAAAAACLIAPTKRRTSYLLHHHHLTLSASGRRPFVTNDSIELLRRRPLSPLSNTVHLQRPHLSSAPAASKETNDVRSALYRESRRPL